MYIDIVNVKNEMIADDIVLYSLPKINPILANNHRWCTITERANCQHKTKLVEKRKWWTCHIPLLCKWSLLNIYNPLLGCPKINFFSWIEPLFLYGMRIGHRRPHAKFQNSGLNDLVWPPLFVNGSWPSRKSLKMTWKLNFWHCHLEGHEKMLSKMVLHLGF